MCKGRLFFQLSRHCRIRIQRENDVGVAVLSNQSLICSSATSADRDGNWIADAFTLRELLSSQQLC
jgi:hypothetical protein